MNNADMRIGNKITVLVPANKYEFNCAWTEETLLPALELFSCKLLLTLEKISTSEISDYFGLNERETEQLIKNLISNKLSSLDSEGLLTPTNVLKQQSSKGGDVTLINYTERNETVIFDSLTNSIRKNRNFSYRLIGLPELSIDNTKLLKLEDAISIFSAQYKTHLSLNRKNEREKNRTKLYKVVSGVSRGTIQFPVDIEFYYSPRDSVQHEVKRISRASEYVNSSLQLPLSVSLEAHVADYLGSIPSFDEGTNAEEYSKIVKDDVLREFSSFYDIDYIGWLKAREAKRTGYGTQLTRSIFGPIYLDNNQVTIINMLKESFHQNNKNFSSGLLKAYWLASKVSLWGANNHSLNIFSDKIKKILSKHDNKSNFIIIHQGENVWDEKSFRNLHCEHANSGIMTSNKLDRIEIFLIPGILGLAQYHGYPNKNSGVSVPIGYVTIDRERLEILENLLINKLGNISQLKTSWPKNIPLKDLIMPDWNLNKIINT